LEVKAPLATGDGSSKDVINSFVSNIVEKLQSPNSEERACGCQMLNGVVFQPKAIDLLVEKSVARIIYSLFLDSSSDVQMNIIGAVRNICINGTPEICNALVDSDIFTPLTSVIKKYAEISASSTKEASKTNSSSDVLVEALKLFSVLCESNPKTVSIFNKENLLQCLLPMMNVDKSGYNLPCAIAQCLFVVSENNPEVTACIKTDEFLQLTDGGDATDTGATLLRTLVIGILLNLNEADISPHMETIIKTISEVLDIDHVQLLKLTLESQEQSEGKEASSQDVLTSNLDKLLQSQGICMELLANLCCSDDEWEDMEAEDMEESADEQITSDAAEMQEENNFFLTPNIGAAFNLHNLMSKILQKTVPIEKCDIEKLQHFYMGKNVQCKLQELQSRALLCLSNVVSALDGDTLTKTANLQLIWANIYSLANQTPYSPESGEDYKWAVTSAMRALIERMAEFNISDFSDVTMENLEVLINIGATSSNHETQINVMRVLSTVGCVLSNKLPLHPLLTKIGVILIEVACKNENVVVVSEALDCIFDVFKEDHTDGLVQEIGLVDKLKSLEPTFKNKISSQRKQLGENVGVVMMAKANLKAYIKYKTGK